MEKTFPLGTQNLYGHLGVHGHDENDKKTGGETHPESFVDQAKDQVQNAPHESQESQAENHEALMDVLSEEIAEDTGVDSGKFVEHDKDTNTITLKVSSLKPSGEVFNKIFTAIKGGWPYALIFLTGLFLYLVIFTNFSIVSAMQNISLRPAQNKVETTAASIPADKLAQYNAWIRSYFFDVSDIRILDPDYDISGNGLTNYQKFLLGLNPKKTDTLGIGITDTQALIQGINPLTGGPLTDGQKKIIADNIDLEAISNKITLLAATSSPKVAGANTSGLSAQISINQSIPGTINIPDLNISVPLVWTQDTKNFESDLTQGVVHYPGTSMPGEIGTSYISGHSSNYIWIKSKYNNIFASLDKLPKYSSFSITVTDMNGKKVTFHYVTQDSGIYTATDQAQFANQGKSIVALSTCWPVGTSAKRLVVFGQLTQVDQ